MTCYYFPYYSHSFACVKSYFCCKISMCKPAVNRASPPRQEAPRSAGWQHDLQQKAPPWASAFSPPPREPGEGSPSFPHDKIAA